MADDERTPEELAAAVDAAVDAVSDALDEGDVAQAQDLLISAQTVVDELLDVMNVPDPDDADESAD